ncbi:MAG: tetratricopeptide repeat protein [Candidatus Omnitrophica bacterium]|nr:tetratricopeptide repeat protein [Candidatus Omnitrophota bacterium]
MRLNRTVLFCLAATIVFAPASRAEDLSQNDTLYGEAEQLMNEKKWDEAAAKLSTIIQNDKSYAPAYVNRGYCYQVKGELDKASEDQAKAIKLAPKTLITAYWNQSAVFQLKGDLARALAGLTKAIEMFPENPGSYQRRAAVYFDLRQYGKALEDMEKMRSLGMTPPEDIIRAAKKAGDNPPAAGASGKDEAGDPYFVSSVKAEGLIALGDWDGAIAKYSELIRKEPDLAFAYLQRGSCYVMKADNDHAIADLARVIELAPGAYPEAYLNRGNSFHAKGDLGRAVEDYDKAAALGFNDPELFQSMAIAFYELKKYDRVWDMIGKLRALGVDPPDDFLQALERAQKGEASASGSEQGKSSSDGKKASRPASMPDVDPGLDEVFSHVGNYPPKFASDAERAQIEDKLKDLIKTLEAKIATDPKNQDILWRLGWAYTMAYNLDWKESRDKIELYFGQLFNLNPEHPQGHLFDGGYLQQTGGGVEKSIPFLQKAADLGSDDAFMMLAMAYMKLNRNQDALQNLKKFYGKHPDSEQARMLIDSLEKRSGSDYQVIQNQVQTPAK